MSRMSLYTPVAVPVAVGVATAAATVGAAAAAAAAAAVSSAENTLCERAAERVVCLHCCTSDTKKWILPTPAARRASCASN